MRPLPLLIVLGSLAGALVGQANCSAGAGPPTSLPTRTPFSGNSLYGHPNYPNAPGSSYTGFSFLFDLTLTAPIDLTQIDIDLYDSGGQVNLGNGQFVTSPNQLGNNTNVELWIFPGFTWMGNETNPAVWGLLGTGTLTVAAPHQHSPAVFSTPVSIPPGLHGFAFKVDQTTTGMNPGPLHPMVDPLTASNPAPSSFMGPAVTVTNLVFQRESWTSTLTPSSHWQNLEWHYSISSGYATWTSFGTGCVPPNDPMLTLQARPVIGNTVSMQTANIQSGTSLNFWLFGFAPDPNGFGLGGFGMPGCNLYLQQGSPLITNVTGVTGGTTTVSLAIPNMMSLAGTVVYGQAAPATQGLNAAGILVSNAVCIAVGQF